MRVPFIDLKPAAALVRDDALGAWERVVAGTEFVGGPTVAALEQELGQRLGAGHVVCCSSGTHALVVALQAMGVGPGSKVALPDLTFWATYEAVAQLGATAVLVDVDPDDLQLDTEELRRAFERHRFSHAILVHLMGWASARLGEIRRFCAEHAVGLLEDGAQSYGVEVAGRPVYAGARVSTLSFYPAKVIGGCMDGGAVLTDDEALAQAVRRLCNHGRTAHYAHSHVGWSSRSGGLQASWLRAMLRHAPHILAERRAHEVHYRAELAELAAIARPHEPPGGVVGNGYLSVFELTRHEHARLAARLGAEGISVGRVYPEAISEQAPAHGALRASELSRSRAFCRRVINLPLYYGMTDEEQHHVCATFAAALRDEP